MSRYIFTFRGGAFVTPGLSPGEIQEHLEKWRAWVKGLATQGHHLGGQALQREGKSVRGRERTLTDGPYAESKDLVTGNLLIEAPSLESATALASGCPIFEFDGSVEVRPVIEQDF